MGTKSTSKIKAAVTNAALRVATDSGTATTVQDVPKIVKELTPVIANATNQEPWYQSRVTIGAILAIVAPLALKYGYQVDTVTWTEAILQLAPVIGGVIALVGRYVARKPILA